jgi:hypothetical protein
MTTDEYRVACRTLLAVANQAAWARRTLDGADRLDDIDTADARCQETVADLHDLLAQGSTADGPSSGAWALRPIP